MALSLLPGVPAVVDGIPSYKELREFVFFGDWEDSLAIHAADPNLGRRQVHEVRAYLRAKYTRQRVVQQWSDLLRPLAA